MEASEGRKCVWCGSPANSKEHVYPQWLRKFIGPSSYIAKHGGYQAATPRLIARTDPDGHLVEYEVARGRQTPNLHEVQVKQVCKNCNNQWMSQLESVESLIRRLTLGPGAGLSDDEGQTLAIWAHKTFLMYDLWEEAPDRRYREADYESFYSDRKPYGDVQLYLAASHSPHANFAMWSDSCRFIPAGVDPELYVAEHEINCGSSYFAVDGVVIVEYWFSSGFPSEDPTGRKLKKAAHRKMKRLGMQQLWPDTEVLSRWPKRVLNDKQTEAARLSLFNALGRLPVHARRIPPPD